MGRISTVPPAAVMAASAAFEKAWAFTVTLRVSSPRPRTLTRAPLWARPLAWSDRRADLVEAALLEGVEVDALVLDPERVVEALELRQPHVQRHLAALEAGGDVAAGLLALGAAAGGLAALAADAAADALACAGSSPAAGLRSWILMVMRCLLSSTVTRCGHPGEHPADLGAVGKGVRLADAAEAEGAQRAALLGLGADGRPDLGDLDRARRPSRHLFRHVGLRAALALAVGARAGPWARTPRRSRPRRRATSSGRFSDLRPSMVARATLMWLDEPSDLQSTSWMPASSRMARAAPPAMTPVPGAAGLSSTRPAPMLADDRVGDGGAGERHLEEVLARLLGALLDGEGHLLGLAVAEADAAVAVADHHEGGEGEAPAALHDLGDAVDVDDARLAQRRVARLHAGSRGSRSRSRGGDLIRWPSELQSGFAGGVGEGGDPAVVEVAAAVEDDLGDAGGLGPLGDELADLGGGVVVARGRRRGGRARWSRPRRACGRRGRRSPGRRCACSSGTRPGADARPCPRTFLRTRR